MCVMYTEGERAIHLPHVLCMWLASHPPTPSIPQSTCTASAPTSSTSRSPWTSYWTTSHMVRPPPPPNPPLTDRPTHSTNPHSRRRRRGPRRVPRKRRDAVWTHTRTLHHHHARNGDHGTSASPPCSPTNLQPPTHPPFSLPNPTPTQQNSAKSLSARSLGSAHG